MISSFFKQTKPINYLVVAIIIVVAAFLGLLGGYGDIMGVTWWVYFVDVLLVLFTVFVVGITVYENKLSGVNTYPIFIFSVLLLLFPTVFFNPGVIITHLLILLSVRRITGLQHNKNIKAKIFDAFLLVGLACFMNSWCVLFFLLGLLGILFYQYKDIKNWLTIVVALSAITIGYVIYMFYIEKSCVTFPFSWEFQLTENIESHRSLKFLLPLSFLFFVGFWAVLVFLASFQSKSMHLQKPYWLLLIMLLLATFMELVSLFDRGTGLVYLFFPLCIFITSLLEKINKIWIKELLLWIFIILPFIRLML